MTDPFAASTSLLDMTNSLLNRAKRGLSAVFLAAGALSGLAGCDLFDVDGTGTVSVRQPAGPFAAGDATIFATYELSEEVDDWSPTYRIDGGDAESTWFAVDEATGEQLLDITFDTTALGIGEHTLEVSLYVDGETVSDTIQFEIVEGVVLKSAALASVGYDGDYGGSPEPEVHLFDASDDAWLGCAGAYDGLAIRGGGGPLLRSDLEGKTVYVMVIENDSPNGCEAPDFADDIFGQGDDFLGKSDAFILNGDVAVEAGAGENVTVGFGVGQ